MYIASFPSSLVSLGTRLRTSEQSRVYVNPFCDLIGGARLNAPEVDSFNPLTFPGSPPPFRGEPGNEAMLHAGVVPLRKRPADNL